MKALLSDIGNCTTCSAYLPHGPRPVVKAGVKSRIVVIGQAPGQIVHRTGIPWNDKSGEELRRWMNVTPEQFYNTSLFALMPMGFCYPGKGASGDNPPRPECAPQWHPPLLAQMKDVKLILLIGQYSQNYYLGNRAGSTLTETVRNFVSYLPQYFPLVHPSHRNRLWQRRNPWFETDVLPHLQKLVHQIISK